jgi:hypothetical protein
MGSKAGRIFLGGVVSQLLAALLCLPLLRLPPGITIKPMGLTFLLFLIGASAFALPSSIAKAGGCPDGSRVLRLFGKCLCYMQFPASVALLHFIAWLRGFSFG